MGLSESYKPPSPKQVNEFAGTIAEQIRQNPKYGNHKPLVAIILGSGTNKVADNIDAKGTMTYEELGMPKTTVHGHEGKIVFGRYGGKDVVAFKGRFHCYEGHHATVAALPVHIAKHLGIETLVMTAAAGLAPTNNTRIHGEDRYPFKDGDVALAVGYFPNFLESSLRGDLGDIGNRFNGAVDIPSPYLVRLAQAAAKQSVKYNLQECLYVARPGSNFETPIENDLLRFFASISKTKTVGGMSSSPELEVAKTLGMGSLLYVVITNRTFDSDDQHEIYRDFDTATNHNLLGLDGKSILKVSELKALTDKAVEARSPSHEAVTAAASDDKTAQRVHQLMQSFVYALRY